MRPNILLAEAERSIRRRGAPVQEALRRSVSSAYYALFHCLTRASAESVTGAAGGRATVLGSTVSRWFRHDRLKTVCVWYLRRGTNIPAKVAALLKAPSVITPITGWGTTQEIYDVAEALVSLQEARHRADYDVGSSSNFTLIEARAAIAKSQTACEAVARLARTPEGRLFMLMLLSGETLIAER